MRVLRLLLMMALLMNQGCVVVALGAVAGAAAGITYTVTGTAERTYNEEYDTVVDAVQKALVTLDIKTGEIKKSEEAGKVVDMDIQAFARDLTITIRIDRLSEKATHVAVDASKQYFVKDSATAGEILTETSNNLPNKAS